MKKADAVNHFGGASKLAKLLGVSRQAVHKWPDEIPDLYQYRVHYLSGGELPLPKRLRESRVQK